VYNGENYLAETLDALLSQTFTDCEFIISDNASTDGTQEICQLYAAKDQRVHYYRNQTNLGAARNYNRVFELSSGEYFKWAAHDDLIAPEYLERCVDVLEHQPSAVICHTQTWIVDEEGSLLRDCDDGLDFRSSSSYERFRDYLSRSAGMWNAIFGLIRATELAKTPLIGSYDASDQVLLGELVLRGEVHRATEPLFFRRHHPEQSWRVYRTPQERAVWFDTANRGRARLPRTWEHYLEYLRAIRRVELGRGARLRCYLYATRWLGVQIVRRTRKGLRRFSGHAPNYDLPRHDPGLDQAGGQHG
jgi:glycosyltransferase involved in cell wall biosynthesis